MNDRHARWPSQAVVCAALLAGGMLLTAPQTAARGFADGVQLCLHSVLPALFPFFVLCGLLTSVPTAPGRATRSAARLLGLGSGSGALDLLLAWLGGYVVCAQLAARERQRGNLTASEAERLLILGCCAGPGFVIGSIGGLLLGSIRVGVLLYGMQLAANLLTAACLAPFAPRSAAPAKGECVPTPPAVRGGLPGAISAAVDSSLQVCGCTVFFCVIAALLQPLMPSNPLAGPLVRAALEFSTGSAAFAALRGRAALYGLALCISLPGLSVFCQMAMLLNGCVPLRRLFLARLLHAVWYQVLVRLGALALPGLYEAFSSLGARVVPMNRLPPDAAAICFLFMLCALYKLRQTLYNRKSSTR